MATKELPKGSDGAAPPKKRSRFKVIMLISSLVLLLGAGGGAGYWWLFMRPDATGFAGLFSSSEESGTPAQTQDGGAAAQTGSSHGDKNAGTAGSGSGSGGSGSGGSVSPAPLIKPVPLPSLTVNLADPPGDRYLKIGLEVEFSAPDAIAGLQNQSARVRDAIILLLSSKTVAELTSAEGKVLLKNEIAARLNQILGAPRVVRIYFTEFVIQ